MSDDHLTQRLGDLLTEVEWVGIVLGDLCDTMIQRIEQDLVPLAEALDVAARQASVAVAQFVEALEAEPRGPQWRQFDRRPRGH